MFGTYMCGMRLCMHVCIILPLIKDENSFSHKNKRIYSWAAAMEKIDMGKALCCWLEIGRGLETRNAGDL